jgi:sulfur carrier protein ThiS
MIRELKNLLAVINRDGGQLTDEVGIEESCKIAEEKVVTLMASLHECGQHAERAACKLDEDIYPYATLEDIRKLVKTVEGV